MKLVFAGDRGIGVRVLTYLTGRGVHPVALLLSSPQKASHSQELRQLCPDLSQEAVFTGPDFRSEGGVALLGSLEPDILLSVHFPYLLPETVLEIPKIAPLNLHPALLPFNRGWHTPSWTILDGTPYGATLHIMTAGIDEGDVVHQRPIDVRQDDTADSLYQRVLDLEYEVFCEVWPAIEKGELSRRRQAPGGTVHAKTDLEEMRRLDLNSMMTVREILDRLRALTTNRADEAAFYEIEGRRFGVRVKIEETE